MRKTIIAALTCALAMPTFAHDLGFSGLLARNNREELTPLTMASGKPVAEAPYTLVSGRYYKIKIIADGSAELALSGGDFFRAIFA